VSPFSDSFLFFPEDERSRFLRNVGPYLQKGRNPSTLRIENLKKISQSEVEVITFSRLCEMIMIMILSLCVSLMGKTLHCTAERTASTAWGGSFVRWLVTGFIFDLNVLFIFCCYMIRKESRYRDWLRARRPRGRSPGPGGGKNFYFFMSRLTLGPTQPPIQWVPRTFPPARKSDHSPPTSPEIKKMWISTSTPPYAYMA
jgi:hypothetical protein